MRVMAPLYLTAAVSQTRTSTERLVTWRSSPLPRGWARIRRRVLERDEYVCQIPGPRCQGLATEVDHIGAADVHDETNLPAACYRCHKQRTYEQSLARAPRRRAPEVHPGLRG
jgi:5-methylcytosine-specific restriction enzyme A